MLNQSGPSRCKFEHTAPLHKIFQWLWASKSKFALPKLAAPHFGNECLIHIFALSSVFSSLWPTARHVPLAPLCLKASCLHTLVYLGSSLLTCSKLLAVSFSEFCWLLRFLPLASLCSVDAITVLRSTRPLGTFEGWIIVWLVNQFINSVCHAYYDLGMVWGLEKPQGTEFVSIQRET